MNLVVVCRKYAIRGFLLPSLRRLGDLGDRVLQAYEPVPLSDDPQPLYNRSHLEGRPRPRKKTYVREVVSNTDNKGT